MNQRHVIVTILFGFILAANAFSYKDAKNWGKQHPECKGKHQSPIILKPTGIFGFPSIFQTLKFTDFNKLPTKLTIKNTGHTVEIKADWTGEPPRFTGGPLHGNYVFGKTTFHWAQKRWAEEVVDEPYLNEQQLMDMEMHLFFYRTDLKSFEKAESQKGGLAVLKLWLKTGYSNPEHLFDNLEKNLHKVQSINSTSEIPPFRLASFLEETDPLFQFYEGSLDYPPCTESVTWFIYDGDIPITDNLLKGFRKIKLAEGDVSNVRPPQALNKRQVQRVYNHKGHEEPGN